MSKAPKKIFDLFFDDEVIELIVMHSNLYATSKGCCCCVVHIYPPFTRKRIISLSFGQDVRTRLGGATLGLTSFEFKCFVAIIFMSGFVSVSRR